MNYFDLRLNSYSKINNTVLCSLERVYKPLERHNYFLEKDPTMRLLFNNNYHIIENKFHKHPINYSNASNQEQCHYIDKQKSKEMKKTFEHLKTKTPPLELSFSNSYQFIESEKYYPPTHFISRKYKEGNETVNEEYPSQSSTRENVTIDEAKSIEIANESKKTDVDREFKKNTGTVRIIQSGIPSSPSYSLFNEKRITDKNENVLSSETNTIKVDDIKLETPTISLSKSISDNLLPKDPISDNLLPKDPISNNLLPISDTHISELDITIKKKSELLSEPANDPFSLFKNKYDCIDIMDHRLIKDFSEPENTDLLQKDSWDELTLDMVSTSFKVIADLREGAKLKIVDNTHLAEDNSYNTSIARYFSGQNRDRIISFLDHLFVQTERIVWNILEDIRSDINTDTNVSLLHGLIGKIHIFLHRYENMRAVYRSDSSAFARLGIIRDKFYTFINTLYRNMVINNEL